MWNWYGLQRIKCFFWLLAHNAVMVNVVRKHRLLTDSALCCMCGVYDETVIHMLHDCSEAKQTWTYLLTPTVAAYFFDKLKSLVEWLSMNLRSSYTAGDGLDWCTIFGVTCWYV